MLVPLGHSHTSLSKRSSSQTMANMSSTLGFDPYHQILANVRFFSPDHAFVRIITAREPSGGNFRVAVVREVDMGRHREVVLSETDVSVHMALRALHLRSAEAVHNHIAMYGFDFPPDPKIQVDQDVWGSDDEVTSGFSVDESTVAFSGVISNDGFSDDDGAVDFEDCVGEDAEEIGKIEHLVSELAIEGDENYEPKSVSSELNVTPASSPPTPAANSSKRKARKVRATKSRGRYTRSRSRSKSSARRQPLHPRPTGSDAPPRPSADSIPPVDPRVPRQNRHLPPLRTAAVPLPPGQSAENKAMAAVDIPFATSKPVKGDGQPWAEYMGHVPPQTTNNLQPYQLSEPQIHPRTVMGEIHPFISTNPLRPSFPSTLRAGPSGRPSAGILPGHGVQIPPRPNPTASFPSCRPPTLPSRQQQPDPQPAPRDVRLHIKWPGQGEVVILKRCAPSRSGIVDAALSHMWSTFSPNIRGGPGPHIEKNNGGRTYPALLKGTLTRAYDSTMRNGVKTDVSYDMTTSVGEDLSKLWEGAGKTGPCFEVWVSYGAVMPPPLWMRTVHPVQLDREFASEDEEFIAD